MVSTRSEVLAHKPRDRAVSNKASSILGMYSSSWFSDTWKRNVVKQLETQFMQAKSQILGTARGLTLRDPSC